MPPRDPDIFGDLKPQAKGDAEIFADLPQNDTPETSAMPRVEEKPTMGYVDRMKRGGMAVLQGLATRGPMGAVTAGVGDAMQNIDEATDIAANAAGGKVTDVSAGLVAPETAAKLGVGANIAVRAVPMVLGGQWAKGAAPALEAMARGTMQSALKPTFETLRTGKAAQAIETMLKDGVSVSESGLNKILTHVNKLEDEVTGAIANSTATVSKGDVGLRLKEVFEDFRKQVNPQSDLEAIKDAWVKFRDHPLLTGKQDIPVQLAQDMKRGTYRSLDSKAYGEEKGAAVEAQKALARGLKETISMAVPAVGPANAKLSELLNAAETLKRRVLMDPNKNLLGLAPMSATPWGLAAFMLDRAPGLKSLLARGLYQGSQQIPATAARLGIGYAMLPPEEERGALYDLFQ
jgi:hypothetical protein